jgi:N-acetylneuraminate synthase
VGLAPTWAAVALGACFVERHITLDRAMWGSDQAASVEILGMHNLQRNIRDIEKSMGDGIKQVYPSELKVLQKLRRINCNDPVNGHSQPSPHHNFAKTEACRYLYGEMMDPQPGKK